MTKVKTTVDSRGVRRRLGREVKDATESINMPLTRADIAAAKAKRHGYDVDDPENFTDCVLATCLSKVAGSEVLIFRRHAFVALPGDEFTLRYEVDPDTTKLIHLNDTGHFDDIPANVTIKFRVPCKRRRLVVMRENAKRHKQYASTRGSERKQTAVDPYRGVYRNGVHSTDAA